MTKKVYLTIETNRGGETKCNTSYLLTDNVTGWTSENGETRIYFRNANPFSFVRLHLNHFDFSDMMKTRLRKTANKEGTVFIYSVVEI